MHLIAIRARTIYFPQRSANSSSAVARSLKMPSKRRKAPNSLICCGSAKFAVWRWASPRTTTLRSEEHTSELQSRLHLVCRLLLEKKKNQHTQKVRARYPNQELAPAFRPVQHRHLLNDYRSGPNIYPAIHQNRRWRLHQQPPTSTI